MGTMKNRRFDIYKVPVEALVERARVVGRDGAGNWEFQIRLTEAELCQPAYHQMKSDCIVCTQLLKVRSGDEVWQDLVILDWAKMPSRWKYRYLPWEGQTKLISVTNDQLLFWLFTKGFEVAYEDGRVVRYVRFERSGNMSRNGMLSFINEEWKSELLERITLGLCRDNSLDWLPGGISLSKWEAYKGLAMSDAYSMGGTGFSIRRVAVIPDKVEESGVFPEGGYYTGRECDRTEQGGKIAPGTCRYELIFKETDEKAEINYFDGQGLVDPAFGRELERALYPGREPEGRVSSFQIRMPFVKGVVHSVDFKAFLGERGVTEIRDIFGRVHRVGELDMIITKSQFKAFPWFKSLYGSEAWDRYQEKFEEFDHTLFVARSNKTAAEVGQEDFLNYQVLHSLGLSRQEFEELAEESLFEAEMLRADHLCGYQRICALERPAGEPDDPGYGAMARAARKNPELVLTARFQEELAKYQKTRREEIQSGRLKTRGSVRFFAGDLMMFLNHLLDQRAERGLAVTYAEALTTEEFYAPAFWGEGGVRYGIFRNPHMARNEHAYMKCHQPLPGSERERYLGKLEGVLMVNPESMAAERMAGADYDGDIVNVVEDEVYGQALARRSGREDVALIAIPSPGTVLVDKETKHLEKREYNLLLNQIGNKVGLYSYMAFCKAADAYGYREESTETAEWQLAKEAQDLVRDFTVQVGLEIDSVKSGKKPAISEKLWTENEAFEPFLKNEKAEKVEDVPEYQAWFEGLLMEGYEGFMANHEGEVKCNLNLLPMYVWRVYSERMKVSLDDFVRFPRTQRSFKEYFDRAVFDGDREILAGSKGVMLALGGLRGAWAAGRQEKRRKKMFQVFEAKMTREQKQVREQMLQILYQQYDPEVAQAAAGQIEEFLSPVYFGCFGRKKLAEVHRALDRGAFALARKRERADRLWETLAPLQPRMSDGEVKERFEALFMNFQCGGHQLLGLALQFAMKDTETPREATQTVGWEAEEAGVFGGAAEGPEAWEEFQAHIEMGDREWLKHYYIRRLPDPGLTREYLPRMREEALAICRQFHPEVESEAALRKLCMNYCLDLAAKEDTGHSFLWAVCGPELEAYTIPQVLPGVNDEREGEEG